MRVAVTPRIAVASPALLAAERLPHGVAPANEVESVPGHDGPAASTHLPSPPGSAAKATGEPPRQAAQEPVPGGLAALAAVPLAPVEGSAVLAEQAVLAVEMAEALPLPAVELILPDVIAAAAPSMQARARRAQGTAAGQAALVTRRPSRRLDPAQARVRLRAAATTAASQSQGNAPAASQPVRPSGAAWND